MAEPCFGVLNLVLGGAQLCQLLLVFSGWFAVPGYSRNTSGDVDDVPKVVVLRFSWRNRSFEQFVGDIWLFCGLGALPLCELSFLVRTEQPKQLAKCLERCF